MQAIIQTVKPEEWKINTPTRRAGKIKTITLSLKGIREVERYGEQNNRRYARRSC